MMRSPRSRGDSGVAARCVAGALPHSEMLEAPAKERQCRSSHAIFVRVMLAKNLSHLAAELLVRDRRWPLAAPFPPFSPPVCAFLSPPSPPPSFPPQPGTQTPSLQALAPGPPLF